jgi:uncharacterized RDD family membrane protein YckC
MPAPVNAGLKGRHTDMTGPGPSDPAGQDPVPGAPDPAPPAGDPAQPAGGNWQQAPAPGAAPSFAQQAQQWKPAEVAAGPAAGIAYADLGIRIGAFIIDSVILGIGIFVVYAILAGLLIFGGGIAGLLIFVVVAGAISLGASAVYFIYTWTTMKASPGQRMLGLMTVNEADGSALSQQAAITRWVYLEAPWILSFVVNQVFGTGILGLLVSLAGLGWTIYLLYTTANDPKRQGYHDKMAKSVVVKPVA